MATDVIDSRIINSFSLTGDGYNNYAYRVATADHVTGNPPQVIATVATRRLIKGAAVELPKGFSEADLAEIRHVTGHPDRAAELPLKDGHDLAYIGSQLLRLDAQGAIQPPLDTFEEQSIVHLIDSVNSSKLH